MGILSRRSLEPRSAVGLLIGLLVVAGIAIVFASTLTRSTTLEGQVAQESAAVLAMRERTEAGQAEIQFLETDAFVREHARSLGYGERGEIVFRLRNDAPSPRPIVPIGSGVRTGPPPAPFDAWMELLFGG